MCACQCIEAAECQETEVVSGSPQLFNWITVLLVSMWIGIVVVAAELAVAEEQTLTLEAFLRSLLT